MVDVNRFLQAETWRLILEAAGLKACDDHAQALVTHQIQIEDVTTLTNSEFDEIGVILPLGVRKAFQRIAGFLIVAENLPTLATPKNEKPVNEIASIITTVPISPSSPTPTPVTQSESTPSTPVTSTPVTSTPVTSTPITSTPITSTPVTSTPVKTITPTPTKLAVPVTPS
jgi:hypothetical protein